MKTLFLTITMLLLAVTGYSQALESYQAEIGKWRTDHEAEIKKDNGWLTVVGLFWLKEGKNTVGSGSGYDIDLTDNFKAGQIGEIAFIDGKAILTVTEGVEAAADSKPVKTIDLMPNEKGKWPTITTGSQSFYLIKPGDRN